MSVDTIARGLALRGLSANSPANSRPNVYGADPVSLLKFRKKLAGTRLGKNDTILAYAGDSITAGQGISTGGSYPYYREEFSYPAHMAKTLKGALEASTPLATARCDAVFGAVNAGFGTTWGNGFRGVTVGSGWVNDTRGYPNFGGTACENSTTTRSGTTNSLQHAPIRTDVGAFDVYYLKTAIGSFTVNIDGGSDTTVTQASVGTGVGKATVTAGSEGAHTCIIDRVSGTVRILGIVPRSTSKSNLIVINGGIPALGIDQMAAQINGEWYLGTMTGLAPDLTILLGGGNNTANVPGIVTSGYIPTIAAAARLSGDFALRTYNPFDTGVVAQATQDLLRSVIIQAGQSLGAPVFDVYGRYGTRANYVAQSFAADSLHPTEYGYADDGPWMGRELPWAA